MLRIASQEMIDMITDLLGLPPPPRKCYLLKTEREREGERERQRGEREAGKHRVTNDRVTQYKIKETET